MDTNYPSRNEAVVLSEGGGPPLANKERSGVALVVLCIGMLMIVLDVTVVNVSLPSIERDLRFSQANLAWVVNAYLLTFGGLLLLAGRIGDLFSPQSLSRRPRRLHLRIAALRIAQTQAMLVAARFLQGVGGAMTSAVILGMIVTMFPAPRDQAKAIGVFSFVAFCWWIDRAPDGRLGDTGTRLALDLLHQPARWCCHRSVCCSLRCPVIVERVWWAELM